MKPEFKIETLNIIQNLSKNKYDTVLFHTLKESKFYVKKKLKTSRVKMSRE
jgi:hypothetical protein